MMIRMQKRSDTSLRALCGRGLCLLLIWMKYLIAVWYRHTEEGLYPPRIPGHFLSLRSGKGPGWHRPHASPLNPPTVASVEKRSLSLRRSRRSTHISCDRKKHLWHLESCLYARLCVGAAVRARSGWRDAGKSGTSSRPPLPLFKRQALHPVRITALYVHMGVGMQIVQWKRRSTSFNLTKTR